LPAAMYLFLKRDRLSFANEEEESQSISTNGEKRSMRMPVTRIALSKIALLTIATLALPLTLIHAQAKEETSTVKVEATKTDTAKPDEFKPEQQASKGSVTIGGNSINYDAYAGTLIVHPKGWDDVPQNADPDPKNKGPEASMFYVAYFKSDNKGAPRPVTFLYNGGPGSSTVWLHMGAFGPKRVITADDDTLVHEVRLLPRILMWTGCSKSPAGGSRSTCIGYFIQMETFTEY